MSAAGRASAVVFTNVSVFDGTPTAAWPGEVRVDGERITAVARAGGEPVSRAGAQVLDGRGATLMPGLIESHAHLSWPSSVERMVPGMMLPPDELVLTTARNARILLDHGFTSAYSAGSLGRHVEVALKAQIDSGGMPGPRLIASSIERSPPTDDELLKTSDAAEQARGPDAVRAFVRDCAAMGAKSVKFLLSGEDALRPGSSQQVLYSESEIRAAGEQARESGVWLTGHAQAAEAVKMGLRNGFRVLYHCSYADAEALDMLEARRDDVFYGPAIGILQATLEARPPPHFDMSGMKRSATEVIALLQKLVPELRRRGVRVLPGGDYGFPFNPNGRNARDLELFVQLLGYAPVEALSAATLLGGQIMGMGEELGQVRPGFLADLLLVDGDPTRDVGILQQRERLLAIMQGGRFHKAPPQRQ